MGQLQERLIRVEDRSEEKERAWSVAKKKQFVRATLSILGLEEIRHSAIGDESVRGISGGQRKRVNIGLELANEMEACGILPANADVWNGPTGGNGHPLTVEAKAAWSGTFIESQADVDTFLDALRKELEAAIEADERVQIK